MRNIYDQEPIRLCQIGVGNFGKVLYDRLKDIAGIEIVCAFHPTDAHKAGRWGCRCTTDLVGVLSDPTIHGVIISSPSRDHAEHIQQAMVHQKHIFVEKPVTALYAEALELITPLGRYAPVFMVGHQHRRYPAMRVAEEILASQSLGAIVNVTINSSHGGAFHFTPEMWRYHLASHREGPLVTAAVHLFDTLHYWLGPVRRVCALIKNRSRRTEAPDCNAVLIEMANETMVFLQTNYNVPSEDRIEIFGTEGVVTINRLQVWKRMGRDVNQVPSKPEGVTLEDQDPFTEEMVEFINAIRRHTRPETGFREGLNALAVVEACYRSFQESRWVALGELPSYDVPETTLLTKGCAQTKTTH